VNVTESVLGGLTGIAGLSTLVSPGLRAKYPGIFATGDTRFDRLASTIAIGDRRLTSTDLTVAARDYTITGKGFVSFDRQADFALALVASSALSGDLTTAVKEARFLADGDGRIAVPFRLVGTLPQLRVVPDADFVTRTLSRALAERGLDALVGTLTGKPPAGKKGKERPTDDLLRGLEGLLGR
jgi:hypothetical protein